MLLEAESPKASELLQQPLALRAKRRLESCMLLASRHERRLKRVHLAPVRLLPRGLPCLGGCLD